MTDTQPKDLLIHSEDLPWLPLGPGTSYKLFRVSPETGQWSALLKMDPGARFAPHKHYGAADFYVLKGALEYRAGVAREGDYGYEPNTVEHGATTCSEETIITFTAYGPIIFYNEDGTPGLTLDWEFVKRQAEGSAVDAKFSVAKSAA
ncbi:MAG: 2,4'-dihydroxyacetophenone dioxygenase family protein [Candidatus Binatia bacterium]